MGFDPAAASFTGIKAKSALLVTSVVALVLATQSFAQSNARDDEPPAAPDAAASPSPERLPDIRARAYPVSINRKSRSGHVYLFDDVNQARPFPGRILLLRREKEAAMAFRVLRTYPEQKQFAGKVVRRYPGVQELDSGEEFTGVEKVSDLAPPPQTTQDKSDLSELESGFKPDSANAPVSPPASLGPQGPEADVTPYDPELDAGTSPPPSGAINSDADKEDPAISDQDGDTFDDEADGGMVIEEVFPLDHYRNALSFQFGMLTNFDTNGEILPFRFVSSGIRYSLMLGRMIFLKRSRVQDSLSIDAGFFFYRAINYTKGASDAYTVLPLTGSLRYTFNFGNRVGLFAYAGMTRNQVLTAANARPQSQARLNSLLMSGGVGALFNVGPSWDLRFDAGLDMLAMGLMLKF